MHFRNPVQVHDCHASICPICVTASIFVAWSPIENMIENVDCAGYCYRETHVPNSIEFFIESKANEIMRWHANYCKMVLVIFLFTKLKSNRKWMNSKKKTKTDTKTLINQLVILKVVTKKSSLLYIQTWSIITVIVFGLDHPQ